METTRQDSPRPRLVGVGRPLHNHVAWSCVVIAMFSCSPSPTIVAPAPRSPAVTAAIEPGSRLFGSTCMGCHDDPDPPAPDFSRPLDSQMATRALRALLEDHMPPTMADVRASFPVADRVDLARWLCARSGRDGQTCERLTHTAMYPQLVRGGVTILESVKKRGGSPISPERSDLLESFLDAGTKVWLRDGRLVASVLLVAMDSCGARTPSSEAPAPAAAATPTAAGAPTALAPGTATARAPTPMPEIPATPIRDAARKCVEEVMVKMLAPPPAAAGTRRQP